MKQRYDSYKPSGIDWIGDIPSHWKVVPIKHLCRSEKYSIKTGPFGSQLKGEDLKQEGDVIVYNQKNVIDNNFDDVQFFVSQQKAEELEGFVTLPNDILITSRGTIGRAAILSPQNKMGILHPCLIALRINSCKTNLKWIVRCINDSDAFRKEIDSKSNATTIEVIYTDTIKNIRLCQPPLSEQEAIAAWLDEKCGELDAAIAKVDREIELIDELKQSEISRVVTRGLNPDVPLRPSGINWIGEIPEHWKIYPIKYSFSLNSGATPKTENKSYWDGDIVWITPADYKTEDHYINKGARNITEAGLKSCATEIIPVGGLVFSKRAPIGTVAIASIALCTNQGCISCIPFKHTVSNYFYYLFSIATKEFEKYGSGATFLEISATNFANFRLVVPPLSEQEAIADYLDKKCAEIDGLKEKLKQKREKLVELRQAIISEVVTGKRKVV